MSDKIEGIILRQIKAEDKVVSGRKTILYTASLKTPDGDFQVSRWGKGNGFETFVGKKISFIPTKYSEQYKNYTAKEIEVVEGTVAIPVQTQMAPTFPSVETSAGRRASTDLMTGEDDGNRELFRAEAVRSVQADLLSAQELAKELKLDTKDVSGLVLLADRIGRTITSIKINAEQAVR